MVSEGSKGSFRTVSKPPPIFFLHNPKAGGSAVRALLERPFPQAERAPVFDNSPVTQTRSNACFRALEGFNYYASHGGYHAYQRLAPKHAVITNFRDPSCRIRSLYRYWRYNVDLAALMPGDRALVVTAKEMDFSKFIRQKSPLLRLYLDNFHFRQLRGSGWQRQNSRILDRWIVKRRIAAMPWYFVAEMPEISILWLSKTFPAYKDEALSSENGSVGPRVDITAEDALFLTRSNNLDYDIYTYATGLLASRTCSWSLNRLNPHARA